MQPAQQNLWVQKWIASVSVILLLIKLVAYYFTNSLAILTDALESIVNVIAGFIGWYSLYLSAKPKDVNHPYGHGKAEFLSSAIEGIMIMIAAVFILYKAAVDIFNPTVITQLDLGIYLILGAAIVNTVLGMYAIRIGKKNGSVALSASGHHLLSDVYSTVAILVGLVLLYFTDWVWIDSIVAIIIALFILYTGYKILRKSVAGIMDEADIELLTNLVDTLNRNRRENWVDLHNLRVIKYGNVLHVDCHVTVPWFFNVNEAHEEVEALGNLVKKEFGDAVELFVHSDGCLPFSCRICGKLNCAERKFPFEQKIDWRLENIQQNKKHSLSNENSNGLEGRA